ncbi:MAG: methyltransferase domain-containing protein [Deltaproteobacteria bacterium]|nr:methyltransferase domain-containing protein [Deltaproteobacteria bacterium]
MSTWAAVPPSVHLFYARAYLTPGGARWETAPPDRRQLQPFLHEPGRALDLGCGGGRNALYLAAAGWSVLGVDLYRGPLRRARRRAAAQGLEQRVRFERRPACEHLEADEARHQLILDVLGPASDLPANALDRYGAGLARCLAPGGRALIFTFLTPEEAAPLFGPLALVAEEVIEAGRWWTLASG